MAVGSAAMWILNPIAWLWIGSQLQRDSREMTLGAYLLLLVGITMTAIALAIGLERLNRLYGRVTGAPPELRLVLPWHRSLRDARHGGQDELGRAVSVLDVVMTISVAVCVLAFLVWYFATSPTPPGVGPGGSKD
ncbi:MAG TPA: hypothetical protein VFQ14_00200 [Thermoleophilaceae bacterium]|nr:hypothetical protein [Thermoleophilaceae bacterium]